MKKLKTIFVRGISRSGGTLMTTILDAHPDVAMSYETYEHLLKPPKYTVDYIYKVIKDLSKSTLSKITGFSKISSDLTKYVLRAERSGISKKKLVRLLQEHAEEGYNLDDFNNRMLFVKKMTLEKAKAEGKTNWGTKIVSSYGRLNSIFPGCYFLFMLRDGRDIAASRKKVGNFNQTIEHIADSWCKQINKFEKFSTESNKNAFFVPYEKLAKNPEEELPKLIDKLGLPWSDRILSFHKLDLSIHRNPTGHLSGKQVKKPINTSSIDRWKTDLTGDEIDCFLSRAGTLLKKFGYEI